jgi:hypothetical protein
MLLLLPLLLLMLMLLMLSTSMLLQVAVLSGMFKLVRFFGLYDSLGALVLDCASLWQRQSGDFPAEALGNSAQSVETAPG